MGLGLGFGLGLGLRAKVHSYPNPDPNPNRNPNPNQVLMSNICHSEDNKFVGITMYSPNYYKKAARLVRSCERVGVCCKATLLPPNAFGPDAPEGSEKFRFETISMKPSFILSQVRVRVRVRVRMRVRMRARARARARAS